MIMCKEIRRLVTFLISKGYRSVKDALKLWEGKCKMQWRYKIQGVLWKKIIRALQCICSQQETVNTFPGSWHDEL